MAPNTADLQHTKFSFVDVTEYVHLVYSRARQKYTLYIYELGAVRCS